MKIFLRLIIILFIGGNASAQEMWGVANSNFAGSAGMNLNPAAMLLMPYKWEVTLLTLDIHAENNYIAYPKKYVTGNAENPSSLPNGGLIAYRTRKDKSVNTHLMVKIPAVYFKAGPWAFGFQVSARNNTYLKKVPAWLADMAFDGFDDSPASGTIYDAAGIRGGGLNWIETGISAGRHLNKSDTKRWMVAGTLNLINGLQGAYMKIDNGSVNYLNDTSIHIDRISGRLAFGSIDDPSAIYRFVPNGIGFNAGLIYVSNPHREMYAAGKPVPKKKYDYRVGVSLIDVGFVTISENAYDYRFDVPALDLNTGTASINSQEDLDSLVEANFVNGSSLDHSFTMALPMALSVQYDRCLAPRWFVNASAIKRIPVPGARISRADQLSAAIRYETPFFEASIPYSFYDYYRHRIGFAFRYHFLFAGTDKLGTFIMNDEITGVDVYLGIKINNFEFRKKGPKSKPVRCPAYY